MCSRNTYRRGRGRIPAVSVMVLMALGAPGCGDGPTLPEPDPEPEVVVSAVEPARGEQGQTLDVRILGEQFSDDAVVSWRRHGTADPLIAVEQVTFVSETELVASILIDDEADVAEYDVVVQSEGSSGMGVGAQLFAVSAYTPLAVLSAQPAEGEQGKMLEVRILGEGFLDDAEAAWERDGVADTLIVVDKIVFISETELRATVRIGLETDLGPYDIRVTSRRKKGIGSEDPTGVGEDVFAVQPYDPEPLGWLVESIWAGAYSTAYTINDHGMAAGNAVDAAWNSTAVHWTRAEGPVTFGGAESVALGSNNRGWIVGARGVANDLVFATPFIFEDNVVTDLTPLEAPHRSHALDINEAGTIVGWGSRDYWADPTWPVVWLRSDDGTYGAPMILPLPDGEEWAVDQHPEGSRAVAINERGDVAGTLVYGTSSSREGSYAVLWKLRPDGTYDEPVFLGSGGSAVRAMNDAGWIVGVGRAGAVLWHPDDYSAEIALDEGAGAAMDVVAINDAGQVAGTRWSDDGTMHAALWTLDPTGTITDVVSLSPAPGFTHARALGLNADGWVVGESERYEPHRTIATLWRPEGQ